MTGETKAEGICSDVKSGKYGDRKDLGSVRDDNMLHMDNIANYVTFDGEQARALIVLEKLHSARLAWFNRKGKEDKNPDRWINVEDRQTGKMEPKLIDVDYFSPMVDYHRSIRSKQITVGGRSREEHRHLNTPIQGLEEEENPPNWFMQLFKKKQ